MRRRRARFPSRSISTVSPGSVSGTKTRPVGVSATPSPEWPSAAIVTVSVTPSAEQELAVAGAAGNRRFDQPVDAPAGLSGEPGGNRLRRSPRRRRVADDTALAKLGAPGLGLR